MQIYKDCVVCLELNSPPRHLHHGPWEWSGVWRAEGAKPGLLSGSGRGPNRIGINMVNIVNIHIPQQNWVLFQNPFQSQTFQICCTATDQHGPVAPLVRVEDSSRWKLRSSKEILEHAGTASPAMGKTATYQCQVWQIVPYYVYYICKYYTWIYNTSYV